MKTYVTRAELLQIINSSIADLPECADCEVSGPVYHLRNPEPDGTNWSDSISVLGHGRDPGPCVPTALRAAAEARSKYALRNDGGWLDDIVFTVGGHHVSAVADQRNADRSSFWYVSIDSNEQRRAFPASSEDRDPQVLRDQIFVWLQTGEGPTRSKSSDIPMGAPLNAPDMPRRYIHRCFQIDTNRINSRGGLEFMNKLEKWHEDGVIHLDMSEAAQGEARSGGDQPRAAKASKYIYSMTKADTAGERRHLSAIEAVLFSRRAGNQNERNDVEIVFNSLKYGRILVTNDGDSKRQPGGILGRRSELARLGVKVMRDAEAVAYIKDEIRKRDQLAREISSYTGEALPEWLGKDYLLLSQPHNNRMDAGRAEWLLSLSAVLG